MLCAVWCDLKALGSAWIGVALCGLLLGSVGVGGGIFGFGVGFGWYFGFRC